MRTLHQREVVVDARELVGQRMLGLAARGERGAQEGDQVVEHLLRARRVGRDQRAQVGQRVEQHVRLELRLQHVQPRERGLVRGGGHAARAARAPARGAQKPPATIVQNTTVGPKSRSS